MKLSTAWSSTATRIPEDGPLSQGWGLLSLMLAASPGASAEGSAFWSAMKKHRASPPTDLLRFLTGGWEETCELGKSSDCDACTCAITLLVSCRKMMEASSRYPSQTSLRLTHRRHEGRPSSQRTRRCLQRRHPRLRRPIGIKLAHVQRILVL